MSQEFLIRSRTSWWLLIGGGALCTSLALAPVAAAERVWDIEEYDRCMSAITIPGDVRTCCVQSGGDLTQGANPKCVSPPAGRVTDSSSGQPPITGQPKPFDPQVWVFTPPGRA
jgi:hypothetical protein